LQGAMRAWLRELEKTIDQLKSLLNERNARRGELR